MSYREMSHEERNPIVVFYETRLKNGFTHIIATSKLYWECEKHLDEGNGLHYDEITTAMINVGAYEVSESVYEPDDGDVDRVIQEMKAQGFLMVKDEDFSAMIVNNCSAEKERKGKRMEKDKKKALSPVSLGLYRQWIFDCAARLMETDCTKEEIANHLIDLSDYPIQEGTAGEGKIKVIIHSGIVSEVWADEPAKDVDVEIVDIDKDYEDYEELQAYEEKLNNDKSLQEIGFSVAHFGEEYDN